MQEIIYTGEKPKKEVFEVYSNTLEELFISDPKVVYIDADLMSSMKTNYLWEKYPNNVFNTGIQEANMVGVAGGMSLVGLKPYIHTFAPFASRRDLDQLYVTIGYANKSVRVIGSEPGICAADNGGTHMTFEDIAIMRCIPNACVIDVSDAQMFRYLLKHTKDRLGITYFRTPRRNLPDVYSESTSFGIGKGKSICDGNDLTIIASGIMLSTALEASNILKASGIHARVIDPITIKPLDADLIVQCARETGAIVTAENHNVIGGLGGAVSELLSERFPVPIYKVGVMDVYGQVGNEVFLRNTYQLRTSDIVEKAMSILKVK